MTEPATARPRRPSAPAAVCAFVGLVAAAAAHGATLFDAVQSGDLAQVRAALAQGADANARDVDGATPLLYAAHLANVDIVRALVAAHADANAANRYGVAPLHEAAQTADPDLIRALLDAGAEADRALPEGETPLMLASRTSGVAAVKLLIEHGANVNVVERWQGQTPLMYAAAHDRGGVAAALIAAGADKNAKTPRNDLPARLPAARFNVEFPLGGMTPVLLAARQGSADALRVLIQAGADLETRTPEGFSALVLALHNFHYDAAKLLIDAGASPKGGALYAVVNARNFVPLIGPHQHPTGKVTELELLAAMLAHGADVLDRPPQPLPDRDPGFGQIPTKPVDTALIRAARSADVEAMKLLIGVGADPKLPEPDGFTTVLAVTSGPEIPPLVTVDRERPAEPEAVAALAFLVEHGVDVNAGDRMAGATALHTAAKRGYVEVVRFLAAHGADLNAADRGGRTPLDYALGRSPAMFGAPPESPAAAAALRELGAREGTPRTAPPSATAAR
ncbi:MAG TPA: ankyrin repeat domain-containing protein [Gammaproteobacteria bacterium]|nr:ankyrin repeat domain-containing protein [Gammaproteobacteria bacterium]